MFHIVLRKESDLNDVNSDNKSARSSMIHILKKLFQAESNLIVLAIFRCRPESLELFLSQL